MRGQTAGAALKVAQREFMERATSRAFLLSNVVLVVVLVLAFAFPALVGGDDDRRLAHTPQAEPTAQVVAERAAAQDAVVQLVAVPDDEAARAAVEPDDERDTTAAAVEGDPVDAALLDDGTVVVWEELPDDLESLVGGAVRDVRISATLAETALTPDQQAELLAPPPLDVEALSPQDEAVRGPALAVGAIAVFVLYGLLIFYGQHIAQGVVEEKSSRVVEVLLSTVRPTALLYGKIVGLTALGVAQTLVLAVVGVIAATLFIDVTIPPEAYGTIALAVAWFLLGFLLYATIFAVAASLVSRQEDLQSTIYPAVIPIFVGFFVAQYALQNPRSTVSIVAALVPFTAPLVQPLRHAAQVAEPWEIPVAATLCVLTIALFVPVAARLYSGSALRFGGRVRLGDAWRATRS